MRRVKQIVAVIGIAMLIVPLLPKVPVSALLAKEQASTYEELWDDTNEAYIISTVEDLKLFRDSLYNQVDYSGKTVYLLNDIKLAEGDDAGSVGNTKEAKDSMPFNGTFHGRGHCIEGWNNQNEALFLKIGNEGVVTNLAMKQVDIKEAELGTALAYQNGGTICQCMVSGTISGEKNNYSSFCFSNTGSIINCISSAHISTTKEKSALAGIVYSNKNGTVSNCIYRGVLSTTQTKKISLYGIANDNVDNSYYLGQSNYKEAGTSCTEEKMKEQSTYIGFDFENIWNIEEEKEDGFPFLRTGFPDLKFIIKIPIDIEVQVQDYMYQDNSAMRACYFPLAVRTVYAGKDETIQKEFDQLAKEYQVSVSLREAKWREDFMVDVPINGVSQDFSDKNASDYFDFTYTKNDTYEFYVNHCTFTSTVGTYYDNPEMNRNLTDSDKEQVIQKADAAAKTILDQVYQKYGAESMNNTWFDFTCARAGYYPQGTSKDEMFRCISNVWHEYKTYQTSVGKLPETTETSRFVLAVTALGFDATDVAGDNLVTELLYSDHNGKYFAVQYLAYALYSGRYGDYSTYIKGLVKEQMAGSKGNSYCADDMATMYMQPVFLLYNKNAAPEDEESYAIKNYVEGEVIPWMKRSITGFGTFYSTYTHCSANVWTDAQAQMLLALLGVDFLSDDYVKNGNTILDYITKNPELSLGYQGDESQCARAIVSLVRSYRGQKNLFDCTDVTGVREVEAMIEALPIEIKESDTELVNQVQATFLSLTKGQQEQVDNAKVLELALNRVTQIALDKEIAARMQERIAGIGTVTLEKEELIQSIRTEYDKLTQDQKARVDNYSVLKEAEKQLTILKLKEEEAKKKQENQKKQDQKDGDKKENDSSLTAHDIKHNKKTNTEVKKQQQPGVTDKTPSQKDAIGEQGAIQTENVLHPVSKGEQSTKIQNQSKKQNRKQKKIGKAAKLPSIKKNGKTKDNKSMGPASISGKSSLILNEQQRDQEHGKKLPYTIWIYTGTLGVGILLLPGGLKMSSRTAKKEEGEHENEETNCQ